ncbi:MAG: hypothetical protein R3195_09310 [Gemmatimonadota bacterium]|nr:hypothetical protein [Gemmatimonadota bacterium]
MTHAAPGPGDASPLMSETGRPLFPDRDLVVGPGYWMLVREDGRTTFSFADTGERASADAATLAHAYIRAPRDLTVGMRVDGAACAERRLWLNGQTIDELEGEMPVRLAAGWNTILVSVVGEPGCADELSVVIGSTLAPLPRDEPPLSASDLEVQASRPPGARGTLPSGAIVLGSPRPVELVWAADAERLLAQVEYAATAWGGGPGSAVLESPDAIPDGPPTVDLTGEWSMTFYMPVGIQRTRATLEMSEDGELTGRLEGERLDGDIRDGWVAGEEFGWTMRFGGRGADLDIRVRGVLREATMSGAIELGRGGDTARRPSDPRAFQARFEGRRAVVEGETEDATEGDVEEAPEEDAGQVSEGGRPGSDDPAAEADTSAPADPADPDGLRARIVAQLLPPPDRPLRPAPTGGTVEIRIGGAQLTDSIGPLSPLSPWRGSGRIEFRRLRQAALDDRGVEGRVRWADDDYEFRGSVSPAGVLEAFHRPIALSGWGLANQEGFAGSFRVPEALAGFSLRTGGGEWSVDGTEVADGFLCRPCARGARLDIRVTGTERPVVEVDDPGFPDASVARDESAARTWLDALRGDNERYRELGRESGQQTAENR